MSWKRNLRNAVLGGAVLLGGMAVWSVPARADSCSKVQEERLELQRAIDRYGYWSPQAEQERRDLRKAEAKCGYNYGDPDDRYRPTHRDRDDWR
jgi:hypothetical protein